MFHSVLCQEAITFYTRCRATFLSTTDRCTHRSWCQPSPKAQRFSACAATAPTTRIGSYVTTMTSTQDQCAQHLSVLPVCLYTVSRTIELSLQSSFQLSLTVLVRYRTRVVFSLGWSLPPDSGCMLKQPYSILSTIQQSPCSYGLYTLCELNLPQSHELRTCTIVSVLKA